MALNDTDLRLAVLIDADNIPHRHVQRMMEEIARYGTPTFKRIYGDWTRPTVAGWKSVLLQNAITPVQQYSYTTGKNATDSAMIIDAMDILYSAKVDGFCIVSSDSDFTRLATRLREAGMKVIGIGEKKTPNPFVVACDKFIYLEILEQDEQEAEPETEEPVAETATKEKAARKPRQRRALKKLDARLIQLIATSITDLADESGWASLGGVGTLISKKQPDFDSRNYGFAKLSSLLKSNEHFELDERETGPRSGRQVFVRNRESN
jgi:uncharacterized LabA/DUF88 family protein